MYKNVTGQKWYVTAITLSTGAALAGDAANITAKLSKDGAAGVATNDVNPTELESGRYVFDLTQAETNYDSITIIPVSSTGGVSIIGSPETVYPKPQTAGVDVVSISGDTTAADNAESFFDGTGYAGTNNVIPTVTTLTGHTAQTGDNYARIGAPAGASVSADVAAVKVDSAAILDDTGTSGVLLASTATSAGLVDDVWDEVLTGATHNVATSAGRRLRGVQDNQAYDDGAIWIDTLNGTAGTTVYENGTAGNPVDTLADALTLAAAANVKHLHIVNGSTITLASTLDNYELTGDEWGLAFGGQSCDGLSVHNAHLSGIGVTGTFLGNPHILHSTLGAITGPNSRIGWCALTGTITSNGTGTWVIHSCWGLSGAKFDFGAGAGQTIYITDWVGGPIVISNMAAGDVLYIEGRSATLTLDATNTGGTVWIAGDFALTNSGSGQTINQSSRYELTQIISDSTSFQGADVAAILADTADIQPKIGTPAADIAADVAAVKTETALIVSDTNELQTDLANGGRLDLLIDAIKVVTDALGSSGATQLSLSANQIISFTVDTVTNTHTPTITEFQADDITEATTDHYKGRIVIWTSGALSGQATSISDYALVGGIGQFTVVALTEAPANNDTGIVI